MEVQRAGQTQLVATLSRAVAVWKRQGASAALDLADALKSELNAYFYFHGLRGTLFKALDRVDEARITLACAIALANSVAEAKPITTKRTYRNAGPPQQST